MKEEIEELIEKINSKETAEIALEYIYKQEEEGLEVILEIYSKVKHKEQRASLLEWATKYAHINETAINLGIIGLRDKSKQVRYRACGLLANSLREDVLFHLILLKDHSDADTVADIKAAILSIENKNPHYFVHRFHTGRLFCGFCMSRVATK